MSNHTFYRLRIGWMATWWKCSKCGLKVANREDAELLERGNKPTPSKEKQV